MNRALVTLMGRASTNEEPDGNLSQTTYSKELDGTDTSWQLGSIRVTCSSTTRVDHHAGNDTESSIKTAYELDEPQPCPLCDFCVQMLSSLGKKEDEDEPVTETPTLDQAISVLEDPHRQETCHFCRMLWRQYGLSDQTQLRHDYQGLWFEYWEMLLEGIPGVVGLESRYVLGNGNRNQVPGPLALVPLQALRILPFSSIQESNNSDTSWALARSWIHDCINHHPKCRGYASQDRRLPSRLIDLGPCDDRVEPRLCDSSHLPISTRYATLSHRWGAAKLLRLTLGAVESWKESIPASQIPLTYRDAMEAAKQIAVRYLWIDSLCIIQDSVEDWRREAATMGDVYGNSYCNLMAASVTPDSTSGLFTHRNPSDLQPCVIKPPNDLVDGTHGQSYYCFPINIWNRGVSQSPLFTRGWVMQELMLAPRILHFGKDQTFWECLELRACESLPGGIPTESKVKPSLDDVSASSSYSSRRNASSLTPYYRWEAIIDRYSTTSLTFPERDKLTALSGITRRVEMGDRYLAGLWENYLITQLLWERQDLSKVIRPTKYQAPSWSWASINGPIQVSGGEQYNPDEYIAKVVNSDVELAGEDPFGQVISGRLQVQGCLATATLNRVYYRGTGFWSTRINQTEVYYVLDEDPDEDEISCFVLPLVAFSNKSSTSDQESKVSYAMRGLILQPTGGRKGEFTRRGTFAASNAHGKSFLFVLDVFEFISIHKNSGLYESVALEMDPRLGLPQYIISVI